MMKTLGLLRNLLSHKSDIDHVMNLYGKQVMQAVVLILEGDNPVEVKEQALCILANIAGKLLFFTIVYYNTVLPGFSALCLSP